MINKTLEKSGCEQIKKSNLNLIAAIEDFRRRLDSDLDDRTYQFILDNFTVQLK